MKIYKIFISVFSAIVVFIVILIAMFLINQDFKEFVLSSLSGEETVYSSGYSPDAWKKIKVNDTLDRVIDILGEPLSKTHESDNLVRYFYSKQGPKDTNYRFRMIVFDSNGRVLEKVREFYID